MTVFTLTTSWQKLLEKVEYDRDVVVSLQNTPFEIPFPIVFLRLGDEGPADIKWVNFVQGAIIELHVPKQTSLWGRTQARSSRVALFY